MTPSDYCRNRVLQASSSFFLPLLFLSRPKREAMFAVYAFCREVDDIVDQPQARSDPLLAKQQLDQWRQEVYAIYQGTPQHPVAVQLQGAVGRFGLPMAPFLDLLDGMAMDLSGQHFHRWEELEVYCQRAAVTVGLLSVKIFGLTAEGENFAHHLGMAFQLTNILRDVAEDAHMGRIYLPLDWLRAEGCHEAALLAGQWDAGVERVAERVAGIASRHYRQAWAVVPDEQRHELLTAWIMAEIYHAYLDRLVEVKFNVFSCRVKIPRWQKVFKLWQGWRLSRGVTPDW